MHCQKAVHFVKFIQKYAYLKTPGRFKEKYLYFSLVSALTFPNHRQDKFFLGCTLASVSCRLTSPFQELASHSGAFSNRLLRTHIFPVYFHSIDYRRDRCDLVRLPQTPQEGRGISKERGETIRTIYAYGGVICGMSAGKCA